MVIYLAAVLFAALSVALAIIARRRRMRWLEAIAAVFAVLTAGYVLLLAVTGFPEIVTRSRVVGVYSDEPSNGVEELRLHENSTYAYTFTPRSGATHTLSGKWEFRLGLRYGEVVLHNFSPRFPGASLEKRTWRLRVEEDFGMIRLWTSDTARQFYLGAARE